MDALTHAIEGYTTKAAWEMTDMFHLKAIELIARQLRGAVENTAEGREGMALAQYVAGMGFSNVGLGIVHSMAHGLGALYDTCLLYTSIVLQHRDAFHIRPDILLNALHIINDRLQIYAKIRIA